MMRTSIAAIALSAVALFIPSSGLAMERAAMDQILAMAKARPDAPEFRQALIARLGDAAIKSGEAFDSNGPDFIWAVEAQSLVALADLVVSAGGMMNREAVALGTPVYTTYGGRLGGVDEALIRSNRLRPLTDPRALELEKRTGQGERIRRDPGLLVDLMLGAAEPDGDPG